MTLTRIWANPNSNPKFVVLLKEQVRVVAAMGMIVIQNNVERLVEDHYFTAKRMAKTLGKMMMIRFSISTHKC
jgi:threonine aldolase